MNNPEEKQRTPKTARAFAERMLEHGVHTLEQFGDNPHDYHKIAPSLNESLRILFEIEKAGCP